MLLRIAHDTRYRYAQAIEGAQHIVHLKPPRTPWQQVLSHQLVFDPPPDSHAERIDAFGNHQEWLALQTPHRHFSVSAQAQVRTLPPQPAPSTIGWEAARDSLTYRAGATYDDAAGMVFPSPHIACHADFVAYAQPSFRPGRPLIAAACDLMQRMHGDFRYRSASTSIDTPARESLARREGVCQDFAHVLIACLRSLGLAARYVSGYLLTQPPPGQPRLIGADASHAWVQVYLPDLRYPEGFADTLFVTAREAEADHKTTHTVARLGAWYDLCPTNARHGWGTPGEDYVRVAVGRDFSDVSPVRGILFGAAEHSLDVAVTVEPIEEGL
ncbi:hypothetical protein CCO03_09360 [Comamonas serinivorans]|uniref:Transglutaminase-like domain-containing protein n=1 Tax=Comamonas serinivorans TaxID=1082851 RepID=A0A1Y0ENG7_9BURK|nr:transglutaminase family protein [Comamonas serinivorans]ARU04859.1 hypothetical protein CCO03_09360 [Comamonas serinivorans]